MTTTIREILITRNFVLAVIILSALFGFSLFIQYDDLLVLSSMTLIDDVMSSFLESIRKSNYDASKILNCNNAENPYFEHECFSDAYSNCKNAIVNPEIYSEAIDPIHTTLEIMPDCSIQLTVNTSYNTDSIPVMISTECKSIGRGGDTWSIGSCDVDNLPELKFNFELQSYPKFECEENGNIWISEKSKCVVT